MTIGLVGQKCGMTRIFTEVGESIPVSVIAIEPNRIVQIKTQETDGYDAIQVSHGVRKPSRVNKPITGHYAKAKVESGRGLVEFRVAGDELAEAAFEVGAELKVDLFAETKFVDVTGVSKGKGFAGTIKRHNFSGSDNTHGNSKAHRKPGSIGMCQTPGRVFKNKKMAGQLGNKRCTEQTLELVRVDVERNLIFIRGSVPGANTGILVIKPAVKKRVKKNGRG
jgi:large subunit ribosomal protein L3